MTGFFGEFEVSMDAKGRFLLPAGFKKQLPEGSGEAYVVLRGMEQCLNLYTMEAWEVLIQKISRFNDLNPLVQKYKRLLFSGSTRLEPDTAGRLLLPKQLQQHAGLKKDLIFSAQNNRIELWDSKTYYDYLNANAADLSSLASEISGPAYLDPF